MKYKEIKYEETDRFHEGVPHACLSCSYYAKGKCSKLKKQCNFTDYGCRYWKGKHR